MFLFLFIEKLNNYGNYSDRVQLAMKDAYLRAFKQPPQEESIITKLTGLEKKDENY